MPENTAGEKRKQPSKNDQGVSSGILEVVQKGYGFLRSADEGFRVSATDPYLSPKLIHSHGLRTGMEIAGRGRVLKNQPNVSIDSLESIDGMDPKLAQRCTPFQKLTALDPEEQLILETGKYPLSTRIVDMFVPIGKGQRVLIVSPPKSGKTTMIEEISHGVIDNYPDAHLILLLVDERPEESSHFKRTIDAEIISTDFDRPVREHIRASQLLFERVKRLVESGRDVVLMVDSLTRMSRAFNRDFDSRGKTLTGGLSSGALEFPRRFYGAARNIDGKGSLTIIASILVNTGSKMDELIFQEFKGTGNCEIVLDRSLADARVFPAVDFQKSGTRKEEKLLSFEMLKKTTLLRRAMLDDRRGEKYRMFLKKFTETASNEEFLEAIPVPR
ncbi:MAG: transcription termination factor Rho [bacterium]|nr:MAG: transcription termination factor Rho [bacterium]